MMVHNLLDSGLPDDDTNKISSRYRQLSPQDPGNILATWIALRIVAIAVYLLLHVNAHLVLGSLLQLKDGQLEMLWARRHEAQDVSPPLGVYAYLTETPSLNNK